jgi:alpha-amylase/alpha-mannosidase (GH57 family)
LDALFEKRAAFLSDPWAARNDYIDVVLDRGDEASSAVFAKATPLKNFYETDQIDALRLLEMQRQRLLMFTSCAWFFDEVSGLESTTVLDFGRAGPSDGGFVSRGRFSEKAFLGELAEAKSNIPKSGTGRWFTSGM